MQIPSVPICDQPKGTWVLVPEAGQHELGIRGAIVFLPEQDFFEHRLHRAIGQENPQDTAKLFENEIIARSPSLIGCQVVAFGWCAERGCTWANVLHGELPMSEAGVRMVELILRERENANPSPAR